MTSQTPALPLQQFPPPSLSLGQHPSRTIDLYMDIGSDLVWSPCAPFECIRCGGKPDVLSDFHPPNISSIASVPSNFVTCYVAHPAHPSSDLYDRPLETIEIGDCAAFRCPNFYYAYGNGSLVAELCSDRLSIQSMEPTTPLLHLPNFMFRCAHMALAEPVGVAGFSRCILSLPAQLAAFSPMLRNQFSHSFDTTRLRRPSPLILGRSSVQLDDQSGEFIYNPRHPYFYSVSLEGVSVADKHVLTARDLRRLDGKGNSGMVVDSGTMFTILRRGCTARYPRRLTSEWESASTVGCNYETATVLRACDVSVVLGNCFDKTIYFIA